ncbi:MAG: hypothetical protein L6R28_09615 [Planctomycetes bacterium]|nr:hypothetical protein [Planctomycetota bacterium]
MTDTTQAPRRAFLAVFLVSAALLVFQVSFTRLLSYKLYYHYVFLSISLSLLGLGAAGTYVAVRARPINLDRSLFRWLLALSCSIPAVLLLMASPPFLLSHAPDRVKLIGGNAQMYLSYCSLMMVWLNFAGGVVLARIFSIYHAQMGRLYARDLVGAGVGCLLCLGLMKYATPPRAFAAPTVLTLAAAWAYVRPAYANGRRPYTAHALAIAALGMLLVVLFGRDDLRNFENFRSAGIPLPLLRYEWNHLIRTDNTGFRFVLDGEASTDIIVWDENERNRPMSEPAYTIAKPEPTVGIIGFGGGLQLAEARRAQASKILAVDINPTIANWVLNTDRELNGHLFDAPNIQVVVGEGRHTIRSSDERFDVLVMHAIDTYTATASGAYALTENFLYTKEACFDYYNSLSDDGVMTISRWLFNPPREDMRLFVTALQALEELGVEEPAKHLAMLAPIPDYRALGEQRVWGYLLMTRGPIGPPELATLQAHVQRHNWSILYAPGMKCGTPFDAYVDSGDRSAFRAAYSYLISPVTDASPYLFQFYNPLHKSTYRQEVDPMAAALYQSSASSLLLALAMAVGLSVAFILAPLWIKKRRSRSGTPLAIGLPQAIYFACLGVGFMALEVPLAQVLALYLGHPVYGFSVVLVSLLVASGAGSQLVQRFPVTRPKVCLLIAALIAALAAALFPLVHGTIHWPDALRFAAAVVLVVACGLPMGFPLALGVRSLGRGDTDSVAWAWAVNGAASVIGSCLVMILMVFFSSQACLVLATGCYALAALTGGHWRYDEGSLP